MRIFYNEDIDLRGAELVGVEFSLKDAEALCEQLGDDDYAIPSSSVYRGRRRWRVYRLRSTQLALTLDKALSV